jgi:hypothetical protein
MSAEADELRQAAAQARAWLTRRHRRNGAAREVFIGPDQAEAEAIADMIDRLVARLTEGKRDAA